jgi:hypothetical protein
VTFAALGAGVVAFAIAFFLVRAAVTALFGGGPIVDSDWQPFKPPGEHFKVLMPGAARVLAEGGPGKNSPANTYGVERSGGRISFAASAVHFGLNELWMAPWPARFQAGAKGMLAATPGARQKSEKAILVDGIPGLELVMELPGKGSIVARLLGVSELGRNTLIILAAHGPDFGEQSPEVKKFFGSFEILPEPMSALVALLPTADAAQQETIFRQLKKHGPQAIDALPALEKLLENFGDGTRFVRAAELLGDLGPAAAAAVPTLTKLLKSQHPRQAGPDNGNIRLRAAGALSQIDPKSDFAVEVLKECVKDPNPAVRVWAHYYLVRLDPVIYSADLDELIRDFVRHGNEHINTTDALVKLGPIAKKAVPALVKSLQSKDNVIKLDVIRVLGAIGPPAQEALPVLRAVDVPGQPEFRQAAEEACRKIEGAG